MPLCHLPQNQQVHTYLYSYNNKADVENPSTSLLLPYRSDVMLGVYYLGLLQSSVSKLL